MVVQLEKREALAKESKLLQKKKKATINKGKSISSKKSTRKIRDADPEMEKTDRRQKRHRSGSFFYILYLINILAWFQNFQSSHNYVYHR